MHVPAATLGTAKGGVARALGAGYTGAGGGAWAGVGKRLNGGLKVVNAARHVLELIGLAGRADVGDLNGARRKVLEAGEVYYGVRLAQLTLVDNSSDLAEDGNGVLSRVAGLVKERCLGDGVLGSEPKLPA